MHTHLLELESEAIFILREVVACFEKPVLLFSGGKDSIVLAHLAKKAFFPEEIPFPFLHIDTGYNFPETIEFRDKIVRKLRVKLLVGDVAKAIEEGWLAEPQDKLTGRNKLQSDVLKQMIESYGFQAAIGGARRDEEKARAKERIFSIRENRGGWNPDNQSPEMWNLYNANLKQGCHFRVFPLSDWTERDVWDYILEERIEIPPIYLAHRRAVVEINGQLLAYSPLFFDKDIHTIIKKKVRCRTIGDMPTTGMWLSSASTLTEIIQEIDQSDRTERGARLDDQSSSFSMEDRKRDGYF